MTSTLPATPAGPLGGTRARRWLRGRADDAAWVRPALLTLLPATAVLYVWGLGTSGWANSFYAAAAQAGSQSWTAFFFGSSDAANSITVDKTPASLWVLALSARPFGVNAWSLLVPQALMGVATVGLLYATVRRWYGPAAGLIAGAVTASTPVAVLMFRFNNPDALLVLLMVAGAYAIVRAVASGATKWLVWAGVFVGFGFLAKMLQALLVVPVFALVYLVAGPPKLGRRVWQLLLAGAALVASAGWYVAVVELVPASMRPYVGGSQNNSLLELTLGYNGLGRLSGNEIGSVGGGQGGGWGETGWTRMFDVGQGGQIAWLLPAAFILLVAGLAMTARTARTDRARAGFVLWGGWLLVTAGVFSFMAGIFHAYYTVALAPAVGAVTGMGAVMLWRRRADLRGAGARGGGMNGLINGSTASADMVALLKRDAAAYTWVAAAIGSQNASGYQLATGAPVMAVGGFNGSDPSSSPNAPGCASTRCPSTGSTTRTAASTSCPRSWPMSQASPGWPGRWRPAACRWRACANSSGVPRCPWRVCPPACRGSCCASPPSAPPARSPACCCTWVFGRSGEAREN